MKIRFSSAVYRNCRTTMSLWYLLKPSFKRYWMGQMWYIGTNGFSLILDFRGINTFEDFADALKHPKTWHILKKIKKHFKKQ